MILINRLNKYTTLFLKVNAGIPLVYMHIEESCDTVCAYCLCPLACWQAGVWPAADTHRWWDEAECTWNVCAERCLLLALVSVFTRGLTFTHHIFVVKREKAVLAQGYFNVSPSFHGVKEANTVRRATDLDQVLLAHPQEISTCNSSRTSILLPPAF